MSADPYDYRCHRCGLPVIGPVPFCSLECEQAPTRWDTARAFALRLCDRVRRFLTGDNAPRLLWSVRLADVPPCHAGAVTDWLRLHDVYADEVTGPLEVRRYSDGTYLVDADALRAPLVMPPPHVPGSHRSGKIRWRSDCP